MSSTYTSSLQIQQIGNGEQSGTWGTTTNTNMALVDQAVAGAVTITMSNANRTLTQTNGTSDEARNMVLEVVGTNSGVYQIIVPYGTGGAGTGSKMYLVSNNTTGGYAITIGYASGSTVSIPNGYIATVFGDGTNFFSANTTSAGAFNVNGTLTASGVADVGNLSVGGTTTLTGTATAPTVTPSTDSSTKIATTAFVQSAATAAAQAAYPVGSIYMNASNSTTPATLLGFGSWSALGAGQMLLGAGTNSGNTFTAGSSGGNYAPQLLSHTHSATFTGNALGAHSHTLSYGPNGGGGLGGGDLNSTAGPTSTSSVSAGTPSGSVSVANASSGDQTLGNLPPYLVVYMWVRTA